MTTAIHSKMFKTSKSETTAKDKRFCQTHAEILCIDESRINQNVFVSYCVFSENDMTYI